MSTYRTMGDHGLDPHYCGSWVPCSQLQPIEGGSGYTPGSAQDRFATVLSAMSAYAHFPTHGAGPDIACTFAAEGYDMVGPA